MFTSGFALPTRKSQRRQRRRIKPLYGLKACFLPNGQPGNSPHDCKARTTYALPTLEMRLPASLTGDSVNHFPLSR